MATPTAQTFTYTVDGEPQTTAEHQLTVRQILVNAGLNPETRYLIQIEGNHQVPYEGTRRHGPRTTTSSTPASSSQD